MPGSKSSGAAVHVRCLDCVGIGTANLSATIAFLEQVLGMEHKFKDSLHFGRDPAYVVAPGNNSAVALCPSSSRDLKFIAFRVSEQGFERARNVLRQKQIEFRVKDIGLRRALYFRDPINGYDMMNLLLSAVVFLFDCSHHPLAHSCHPPALFLISDGS
ncbi:hypothetical protein PTSG_08249 [Salpingoeca rosetta]|uniref:VOC domain-containing protein n=1 Tax=Salpingoeca rosetta (strain ATCC 50818 / BSB-021) TaxID=946362 RepID=F2UIF5_SALR5|nr:uncharacterized protein PTSG_08249 [Salpingoeca rosetta]EGD76904.1 hypothetical protein PTSG_08249 [Salpingoeca rosetta]|eukprot:XP_004991275.1 hypothetical protein PTSG_08249 [Salpingoeca rosetta]